MSGAALEVLDRYADIVDDMDAFRRACERPLPTVVRVNPIKATVPRTIEALEAAGIGVTQTEWNPRLLELDTDRPGITWPYIHGWIHGQEAVSTVPPRVLDPDPGERVLDACAAPGSKTTQLAALMADRGLVVANDANLGRLSALRSNADRLGVTCAAVTNRDAATLSLDGLGVEQFDHALVDVPCSCEGTVRKNPDALAEFSVEGAEGIADLQRRLLRRSIEVTKPGGTVVYATCTFAPEENEAVVDAVLDENCRVVPFEIGLEAVPGVAAFRGTEYHPSVTNAKRFYPHHNDTGGFFCAKLEVT